MCCLSVRVACVRVCVVFDAVVMNNTHTMVYYALHRDDDANEWLPTRLWFDIPEWGGEWE